MGMVVQESEIHSVPGMFDAETEKSRFLARSGHPLSHHPFNSHSCVSEWGRSDTSTPARVRGLSATRYRESGKRSVGFTLKFDSNMFHAGIRCCRKKFY